MTRLVQRTATAPMKLEIGGETRWMERVTDAEYQGK